MKTINKTTVSTLLPLWNYKIKEKCYSYIERKVQFPSFDEAWDFLNEAVKKNKQMNHHCKYINDYTKVKIKMYTHTLKDVTEKDMQLAGVIDKVLQNYNVKMLN